MCDFSAPIQTTLEEFRNATVISYFGFVFIDGEGNQVIIFTSSFPTCYLRTRKRKAVVFKLLRFEERFRNLSFLSRISNNGRPNRRSIAAFSNSSGWKNDFEKLRLRDIKLVHVDGGPDRRDGAAFSNSSCAEWMLFQQSVKISASLSS